VLTGIAYRRSGWRAQGAVQGRILSALRKPFKDQRYQSGNAVLLVKKLPQQQRECSCHFSPGDELEPTSKAVASNRAYESKPPIDKIDTSAIAKQYERAVDGVSGQNLSNELVATNPFAHNGELADFKNFI
jgi:hypothetical protein